MIRLINALLAIVVAAGAALLLYWVLNKLAEMALRSGRSASSLVPSAGGRPSFSWSIRPSER